MQMPPMKAKWVKCIQKYSVTRDSGPALASSEWVGTWQSYSSVHYKSRNPLLEIVFSWYREVPLNNGDRL